MTRYFRQGAGTIQKNTSFKTDDRISFVADIGTTTIKAELCRQSTFCQGNASFPEILAELSEKNRQTFAGADVISRVLYAHHNGIDKLRSAVLSQLSAMCLTLCNMAGVQIENVTDAVCTGNTVMLHLLQGLPLNGFEKAPFTPVSIDSAILTEELSPAGFIGEKHSVPVYVPPCADAFVGGDAVCAAFLALKTQPAPRFPLLVVDVGTNTEVLLITHSAETVNVVEEALFQSADSAGTTFSVTACSAAAGPAFEGGRISVQKTGSELVHLLAEMLASGYMGHDGVLKSGASAAECRGLLTQQDVRVLQLAKGAVAAAIDTVFHEAGITAVDIGTVFLCGNFGSALVPAEAEFIGLIPAGLAAKTVYAPAAALNGASLLSEACIDFGENRQLIKKTAASAQTIQLADSSCFAERYIARMNFIRN